MITLPEKIVDEMEVVSDKKSLSKSMIIRLAVEDFLRKEKGEYREKSN